MHGSAYIASKITKPPWCRVLRHLNVGRIMRTIPAKMKKIGMVVALVVGGCFPQPDIGKSDPQPLMPDAAPVAVVHCGKPPAMPPWSYSMDASDPNNMHIPVRQWLDHLAWTEAVQGWQQCVAAAGSIP